MKIVPNMKKMEPSNYPLLVTILVSLLAYKACAQSNYADQANNIEYQGEGLPPEATLNGKVTKLDDISPIIFLNRTKATLNCAAGSMQIDLKFVEKFYGIAYADFDRNSACQVAGKGNLSYKLELPLKGCGTKQDPQRVFTNNIVVRFHPGLEMDGDEIITVVCRYPPPIAPVPALPLPIQPPIAPVLSEPPLKGFQILLIICGILFLSLLLLGLGVSYYCLRRRPVRYIRPFTPLDSESEITKLSSPPISDILLEHDPVKIPRVTATPMGLRNGSTSGSEERVITSDYPSESPSEHEESRSLPGSSAGSINQAYIHDTSSFYSETYGDTHEQEIRHAVPTTVPRLPLAVKKEPPVFRKPPAPSPPASDHGRDLSTIIEREESVRSLSPPPPERTHFTYVPELHAPPRHVQMPPTYSRILKRQQEMQREMPSYRPSPARSIASLNTEMTDTHSVTETVDDSHHIFVAPVPPPPPPITPTQDYLRYHEEHVTFEPPIAAVHRPEITSHTVDDVFLRTITEKKTIEDIERHRRLITEYHARLKPAPPLEAPPSPLYGTSLTIPIRPTETATLQYVPPSKPQKIVMELPPLPQVDDDKPALKSPDLVSHVQDFPPPPPTPPTPPHQPHRHMVTQDITLRNTTRDVDTTDTTTRNYFSSFTVPVRPPAPPPKTYLSTFNLPVVNPEVPNWEVLTKVLEPTEPEEEGPVIESRETFDSQLTMTDKIKWRQIITTESTLRTLLIESVIREDFERIRTDPRFEPIFEPPKWDTIVNILSTHSERSLYRKYKKRTEWDNRSRRSSLPPLYEYDSDGGSSVRTLTREPMVYPSLPRRSSRSSYRSEADLRSMSEMTVDFRRPETIDTHSEASSYLPRYYDDSDVDTRSSRRSLARSLSQPSLARSASEFTERWVAPSVRYDTASEFTTPEGTPKSTRSSRIMPYHMLSIPQPRSGGEHSSWQREERRTTQAPGTSREEMIREYRSEATKTYVGRHPPSGWFDDKDSEASYK